MIQPAPSTIALVCPTPTYDLTQPYYNKECSAYIIQFCVYAEAKETHHISCSRKN